MSAKPRRKPNKCFTPRAITATEGFPPAPEINPLRPGQLGLVASSPQTNRADHVPFTLKICDAGRHLQECQGPVAESATKSAFEVLYGTWWECPKERSEECFLALFG